MDKMFKNSINNNYTASTYNTSFTMQASSDLCRFLTVKTMIPGRIRRPWEVSYRNIYGKCLKIFSRSKMLQFVILHENIISLYPHMQVTVTFSHFLRLVMNSLSSFGYFWYIEANDNKTGQFMHIRFTISLKSFKFNKFRKRYKNWMFRWEMWPMGLCLLIWCKIFKRTPITWFLWNNFDPTDIKSILL